MSEIDNSQQTAGDSRRGFLSRAAMTVGLAGGYGGFGLIAGRYLYPANPDGKAWLYVTESERVGDGESILFQAPDGSTVNVSRLGSEFVAMSSTCPHLGCQVQWESQNNRYFCPCHNGVFDPAGVATGGPPAEAGQSLSRYPVKVEDDLLYILVPTERLVGEGPGEVIERPGCGNRAGHDPCLSPLTARRQERAV